MGIFLQYPEEIVKKSTITFMALKSLVVQSKEMWCILYFLPVLPLLAKEATKETLNALISSSWLKNVQNHQMGQDVPEPDIFLFHQFRSVASDI